MSKKGANINLSSYDDIFSTDDSRTEAAQERVREVLLSELHPFEGHPFRVVDDEDMMKTVESIKQYGVLSPAIVDPIPMEAMRLSPVIEDTTHPCLQAKNRCPLSSVIWTMTKQ